MAVANLSLESSLSPSVEREPNDEHFLYNAAPFYSDDHYESNFIREFKTRELAPIVYNVEFENKVMRIIKKIIAIIIFPLFLHEQLHILAAKIGCLPASNKMTQERIGLIRNNLSLHPTLRFKRITIEVDGIKIDAAIMGTKESLKNSKRWILCSNPNADTYESNIQRYELEKLSHNLKANTLIFNYPGVGESTGHPTRTAAVKSFQAMLKFLEDKQKGLGAKEIIGYGYSIGGGIQAEGISDHVFNPNIKYVFIKSRTFSSMQDTAAKIASWFLGFLVKLLGWNISTVQSSQNLTVPEIILQSAKVNEPEVLVDSKKIVENDGVIHKKATLANALFGAKNECKGKKAIIGIPENHNTPLWDTRLLENTIKDFLL